MIHRLAVDPQSDGWQRAIERAIANDADHKVSHQWTEHSELFGTESLYLVVSNTMAGAVYNVHYVEEDGEETVSCNCASGMHGVNVCWHMAAALLISGILDAPKPEPAFDVAAAGAHITNPMAALQQ